MKPIFIILAFGALIVLSYKPKKQKTVYQYKIHSVGKLTKADAG